MARHLPTAPRSDARSVCAAGGAKRAHGPSIAIVASGEPVYGINTGFGKLAERADRAWRPCGVAAQSSCCRTPPASASQCLSPRVRLMMALKLASLGRGASGRAAETVVAMLEAMLERDLIPVMPSQGSAGASGDLAPLAHMAAAMIGVGEVVA